MRPLRTTGARDAGSLDVETRTFIASSTKQQPMQEDAVIAILVFLLAGLCEISGGWLVWQAVREHRPWWWALVGSLILVVYGFVPCMQVMHVE